MSGLPAHDNTETHLEQCKLDRKIEETTSPLVEGILGDQPNRRGGSGWKILALREYIVAIAYQVGRGEAKSNSA